MIVMAAPGLLCPMEENARQYIDDANPVNVPDSAYYLRLISDGSLIIPGTAKKKEVKTDGQ